MTASGDRFDVVVVGGGHAGIEAAMAAARMGVSAALVTLDAQAIGRMSCNPAIGGLGKGQMVREIDALGGVMGRATDACGIQFRLLNTRKGPAVRAPRAQCDKHRYQEWMVRLCNSTPGLKVVQAKVDGLAIESSGSTRRVTGVRLADGAVIGARAVVLTNGTFLRGLMHFGDEKEEGGRVGEGAAYGLSDFLEELGFERGRLKTGTPPRVERSTVDFSTTTPQPGDDQPSLFSFATREISLPQIECHIAHTCEETHDVIRANLHRAPMYSGQIQGVGPRYCPSIEDKVVRFAEKTAHQIFLEPEGLDTSWVYLNGISTSLPREVQDELLRTIPALRDATVCQHGYAVEYDFFPPTQIGPTFETRLVDGLYFAGQICGTSGYEEAAAQGFLAGVNTVLSMREEEPLILDRSQAFIGVLVDDLVKECPLEPYRMFTSRAEYRLLLRSDNADLRLTDIGRRLGLVSDEDYGRFERKRDAIDATLEILDSHWVDGKDLTRHLRQTGRTLADVLSLVPELTADNSGVAAVDPVVAEQVEIQVKYASYIERQERQVERFRGLEAHRIPPGIDYDSVVGIRNESREKLEQLRPLSVGQASRISGVTPADVGVLMAHIEKIQAGERYAGRA